MNVHPYETFQGYSTDLKNHSTVDSMPYSEITFKCLGLRGVFLFDFSYLICNKSPNENWSSEKQVIPANTDAFKNSATGLQNYQQEKHKLLLFQLLILSEKHYQDQYN